MHEMSLLYVNGSIQRKDLGSPPQMTEFLSSIQFIQSLQNDRSTAFKLKTFHVCACD